MALYLLKLGDTLTHTGNEKSSMSAPRETFWANGKTYSGYFIVPCRPNKY